MFLGKGVLKICRKFTGERPCRSAISIISIIIISSSSSSSSSSIIFSIIINSIIIIINLFFVDVEIVTVPIN